MSWFCRCYWIAVSIGFGLTGCAGLPGSNSTSTGDFQQSAVIRSQPMLESIFQKELPLRIESTTPFPKVEGDTVHFAPEKFSAKPILFSLDQGIELEAGDYVIPVLPFSTRLTIDSPEKFPYQLSVLDGKAAEILRALYRRALVTSDPGDVQILSWSIQYGVPYAQMTNQSKALVDKFLPEHRERLQLGTWQGIESQWNDLSRMSTGLPFFGEASESLLRPLGAYASEVHEARRFRELLFSEGNNYSSIARKIGTPRTKGADAATAPWCRVADGVMVRAAVGPFQKLGHLDIRIETKKTKTKITVDPTAWLAVSGVAQVQPLALAPTWGALAIEKLDPKDVPLATSVLNTILAQKTIDWKAYHTWIEKTDTRKEEKPQPRIVEAEHKLDLALDALTKDLKKAHLIVPPLKVMKRKPGVLVRTYVKKGGRKQLDRDFTQLLGETLPTSGKMDPKQKNLPSGYRAIARPGSSSTGGYPLLEIVSSPNEADGPLRIEIRY